MAQQELWQKISVGLPDSAIVSAICHHKKNLFVGISRSTGYTYYIPGGFYISSDSGKTWKERNITSVFNGEVLPISSFLVVEDTIFAGIPGEGIYKTINEGITWEKSDNGIFGNGFGIFDFLQIDSLLFVSTQNGVYKSEDYGRHWELKPNGLPLNTDGTPFQVKVIISVGRKIYAGVDAGFQQKGGLFVTSDMGNTWTKVLQNWVYNGVTISTDIESIEYFDGFLYIFFNGFWILKSSDDGNNWIEDNIYRSAWLLYNYKNNLFANNIPYLWVKSISNPTWKEVSSNLPNEIWSIYGIDSLLFVGVKYNGIWKTTLSNIAIVTEVPSNINKDRSFSIDQNYPNPFNPTTRINFSISKKSNVRVEIYDMLGRTIRILVNEERGAGEYSTFWDSKNDQGGGVASGIYFYSIINENYRQSKKMILLK
jgi:hypothetical protein